MAAVSAIYRLSAEPLFDAGGPVRKDVTFAQLAEFVWFMESGSGFKSSPPYKGGVAPASGDGVVLSSGSTQVEYTHAENHPVGETPPPLLRKEGSFGSAFLGIYKDGAVFLLYNGILKDKTDIGGNVLNSRTLEYLNSLLPDFEGDRVVYAARTRFDKNKLAKLGITFHQLPYDLAVKTWF